MMAWALKSLHKVVIGLGVPTSATFSTRVTVQMRGVVRVESFVLADHTSANTRAHTPHVSCPNGPQWVCSHAVASPTWTPLTRIVPHCGLQPTADCLPPPPPTATLPFPLPSLHSLFFAPQSFPSRRTWGGEGVGNKLGALASYLTSYPSLPSLTMALFFSIRGRVS